VIWLIRVLIRAVKHYDGSYIVEEYVQGSIYEGRVRTVAKKIIKKFTHLLGDEVITIKKINEKMSIVTILLQE
jgi:hypothetical protein